MTWSAVPLKSCPRGILSIRNDYDESGRLIGTTDAFGIYDRRQQRALVRELQPEAASMALRELCPDEASEAEAGEFFRELLDAGTWPQYNLYSAEEAVRFDTLRREGFFGCEADLKRASW